MKSMEESHHVSSIELSSLIFINFSENLLHLGIMLLLLLFKGIILLLLALVNKVVELNNVLIGGNDLGTR